MIVPWAGSHEAPCEQGGSSPWGMMMMMENISCVVVVVVVDGLWLWSVLCSVRCNLGAWSDWRRIWNCICPLKNTGELGDYSTGGRRNEPIRSQRSHVRSDAGQLLYKKMYHLLDASQPSCVVPISRLGLKQQQNRKRHQETKIMNLTIAETSREYTNRWVVKLIELSRGSMGSIL